MLKIINFVATSDRTLFKLINGLRSTLLDIIMPVFTFYGSLWFAIIASLFLLVYRLNLGLQVVFALLASSLVVQVTKKITNRKRPYLDNPNCRALGYLFRDYSFPSGHTCAACAISVVLAYGYPELVEIWVALAILTGISRVYQGLHYPSDVLAGTFIGCLAAITSLHIF